MLRKYLIQRYVEITEVEEILWHSSFVYLRGMLGYCLLLFVVYVGYAVWHYYQPELLYSKWIIGVVGLVLFVCWVISFLNLYLDCLLLSPSTLTVFLWDGVLEYRTEVLDWSKITAISYYQNSLRDRIFGKGDLVIQLGSSVDFHFNDVTSPKKTVAKLLLFKKKYEDEQKVKIEKDLEGDQRSFEVIMGALGEVVREYMEEYWTLRGKNEMLDADDYEEEASDEE